MVQLSPTFVLLSLFGFFGTAQAWFRLPCTLPLVRERLDPIVSPGVTPSNHVHAVHGGSGFAANSTYETLRASTCTSCLVLQDKSNYWFPQLFFHVPDTQLFEPVGNGGVLVYYQNRGNNDVANAGPGLKAFPAGFRMTSGEATARSKNYTGGQGFQWELRERATEYICLRYGAGVDSPGGTGFPSTNCESGFQNRVHMPACWDGKNLDSPNHQSHVAYLSDMDNGECPASHPVGFMKLFYEITWDVNAFKDRWDPKSQPWPFVWANGDPTGFSAHADFQNGWDVDVLQRSIDECNRPKDDTGAGVIEACQHLTIQARTDADKCRIPATVDEVQLGKAVPKLPGCNPLQPGPNKATADSNCPN